VQSICPVAGVSVAVFIVLTMLSAGLTTTFEEALILRG